MVGTPKGVNDYYIFGGTVGGPIRKDKTFFFGSYEGFRQTYPKSSVESVPPTSWTKGDFSQSGYNIYDPLTATCAATNAQGQCTQYKRTQFANNIIPANRINPIGQAILNLYPAPQFAGSTSNYYPSLGGRNFLYDQAIARIDQYFSDSTRFYGLFTTERNLAHQPANGFPGVATNGTIQGGNDYNAIAALTRVISSSMAADFRLSFGRYTSWTQTGVALSQDFTGDKIGGVHMPVVPTTTQQNIVPVINVTSFTALFGNTNNGTVSNDWDFAANLAQLKGRHNIRYGFEFADVQSAAAGVPGQPNGVFSFDPTWTQSNPLTATAGQGSGIASLLLGYPTTGNVDWNSNLFVTYHYYGLFVQDDFKASKNVTLNLGLRWDVNKSPSERFNRINAGLCFSCKNPYSAQINYSQYPNLPNPLTGGLLFAGVGGSPSAPFDVQWHDWQPRFGISWAVTPKLVFRAGYGMYYSWGRISTGSAGFNQGTPYVSSLDGNVTPTNYFLSGAPYPNGALAPSGSALGLATQAGQAITYASPDRRIPSTQHWSIGLQRELVLRMVLDAEYVGSHAHAIAGSSPWDTVTLAQQAQCFQNNALCNTNVPNPFYGILPKAAALGASSTVQAYQLTLPWPLFNGITQSDYPAGESDYNALQVRLERKVADLDFAINYTYGNWMEETAYLNSGNFRDAKLWRGLDSADVRHLVTIAARWVVPVGKGGRIAGNASGVLGALISHWHLQSNIRWNSGTPLLIPSADFYGPGCTSYAPPGGQTKDHWINNDESCYHTLLPWEARTTPLNVGYLRNPDLFEWSPSMEKRFALPREGMFLQFRAEALNGANHAIFAGPNETVATKPSFTSGIGWVGFGTLPQTQSNYERRVLLSLRLLF
jgi:hypothetical protein